MDVARDWKDYEILDMANGEKLERWKDIILVRPDPQIIWSEKQFTNKWKNANFIFISPNFTIFFEKIMANVCLEQKYLLSLQMNKAIMGLVKVSNRI